MTILETKSGKVVADLGILASPHFSFSAEGKLIAVSSFWGISVIDIKTQRELRRFIFDRPDVTSLKFSPNGKWIASGNDDGTVRIWNAQRSDYPKWRRLKHHLLHLK